MRVLSIIVAYIASLFVGIYSVFAVAAPVNVDINGSTETSISLLWDSVEGAAGYHVYYSDTGEIDENTAQKEEYLFETSILIEGLQPATQYTFVVIALDQEGIESEYSQQVTGKTLGMSTQEDESDVELSSAVDFKISQIEVLAQNQISLTFTSELQNTPDAQRVFKVEQKNDGLMQYAIKESTIDPTNPYKVIVTFEDILPIETEYKLTVVSILDIQGRNIESGIESFENFFIESGMLDVVYDPTQTVVEIVTTEEETNDTPINNKEESEVTVEQNFQEFEGNELTEDVQEATQLEMNAANETDFLENDVISAGNKADTLPTTGPEHVIMFIIALILGAMSYVLRFKKS